MNNLKGDSLTVNGRTAQRDIVQFVAFNEYLKYDNQLGHHLAKDLLAKVPKQLVSFMKSKDISPL